MSLDLIYFFITICTTQIHQQNSIFLQFIVKCDIHQWNGLFETDLAMALMHVLTNEFSIMCKVYMFIIVVQWRHSFPLKVLSLYIYIYIGFWCTIKRNSPGIPWSPVLCVSSAVSILVVVKFIWFSEENYLKFSLLCSVADPGSPRGGGANSRGGRQHTILPNFPKNCMKLKEFGPRGGGRASKILLCRSATGVDWMWIGTCSCSCS